MFIRKIKKFFTMESLKYKIIKSKKQYDKYCNILEDLICNGNKELSNKELKDEIELLTFLIEKWDLENNTLVDTDPIKLLKYLMKENNLKSKDLAEILGLSKGTISKILNYHKGLSKETIRKLANYFKVSQETFNRPYKLVNKMNKHFRNASLMNTKKNMKNVISV